MKKIYLTLSILFSVTLYAKAQSGKQISLSLGPELSIPLNTNTQANGHVRDYYQDGIGGNVKLEVLLDRVLNFVLSAGFVSYAGKGFLYAPNLGPYYTQINSSEPRGVDNSHTNYTFIPATAGLRWYVDKLWYLGADAGIALKVYTNSTTSAIYGGGTGVIIPCSTRSSIDLGLRYARGYQIFYYPSPMSQLSISVAYRFGL
ncbi:MAG: hypothetical protein JST19_22130 [Bacteroidetes bacterium]|nr:hypothetical protein [Bacteroidota bacterium]